MVEKKTTDQAEHEDDGNAADGTSDSQPAATPQTDPTNPHNQEPAGDWVANERAAERRNNEPGLSERERQRRRW